jgi:hypothetical protein
MDGLARVMLELDVHIQAVVAHVELARDLPG